MAKNKLPSDSNSRRSKAEQNIVELPGHEQSALVGTISTYIEAISEDINSALVTVVTGKYSNIKEGNLKSKMTQKNIFLGMFDLINKEIKPTLINNNIELKKISAILENSSKNSIFEPILKENLEKDSSKIKGILSLDLSSIEDLKSWNEFLHSFEDISEVEKYDEAITNLSKFFKKIERTFSKDSKTYKSVEAFSSFISEVNKIKDIIDDLNTSMDTFGKLAKIKIEPSDIQKLKETLDSITEVLNTSVDNLVKASERAETGLASVRKSFDETYKIALSGSEIDSRKLNSSKASISELIGAVAIMGAVMIIGGYIIESHPELMVTSLLFGATFSLFLIMLSAPIALLSIIDFNSTKESMKGLSQFMITASLIMIIGGYFMKDKEFAKNALLFGATFSAFLFLITLPISILAIVDVGGKVSSNLKALKSFIITSVVIMTIGASIIGADDGNFAKNALKFGLVLSAFITLTVLPIFLLSTIIRNAIPILKEVNWFIITASITLLIGASLMLIPKLWKSALKFAFIFSAFIYLTLKPILWYSVLVKKAEKVLDEINDFIFTTAAVMLIGTLFMRNEENWKSALKFGLVLAGFITLTLLPILGFSLLVKKASRTLDDITGFILVSSALLVLGAYMIIHKPEIIWNGLLFGVVLGIFVLTTLAPFLLLNRMMMSKAMMGLLFMGGFILLASVSLFISAMTLKKYGWKAVLGAILLGVFVMAVGVVFALVSSTKKLSKDAAISAAIMALALLEIAVAIFVIDTLMPRLSGKLLLKIAVCTLVIWALAGILKMVAKSGRDAVLGAVAVAIMTIALFGIIFAIKLINDYIPLSLGNMLVKLLIMGLVIEGMIALVKTINKGKKDILMGSVLLGLMVGILYLTTKVIQLIDNVLGENPWKIAEKALIIGTILAGVVALCTIIGIPGLNVVIATGTVILGLITGVLYGIIEVIRNLVETIKLADEIKQIDPNSHALRDVINNFIDNIVGIKLSVPTAIKLWWKGKKLTSIAKSLAKPLALIGTTVADLASLKVAIDWDKEGRPIRYRRLTEADFKLAGNSIKSIITTLASGIMEASEYYSDIRRKTLKKTLNTTKELGEVIGSISIGLQSYANLLIPTKWDPKTGKPIFFKKMGKPDFTDAADNIKTIIITLSEGVLSASKHYDNIDKSVLKKTLDSTSKIGRIISGISSGLQSYANLLIPIAWNSEGNPIKFKQMTPGDIDKAKSKIGEVISAFIGAIEGVYSKNKEFYTEVPQILKAGGLFNKIEFKYSSPFAQVLTSTLLLSQVISGLASGIQSFADLKFATKWDPQTGNPIEFKKLGFDDLNAASKNIGFVITNTITAVKDAYNNVEKYIKPEELQKITEAFVPVGNLVSSLADGVVKMADFKFANYDPKTGKVIGYTDLRSKENVFTQASENIAEIIKTIAKGVKESYNNYLKDMDTSSIKTVMDTLTPISDFINSLAENIANYANGTFKNASGKVIKIEPKDFTEAGENIVRLITAVTSSLIEYYKNEENKKYFENGSLSIIVEKLNEVNNFVDSLISTINEIKKIKDTSKIETLFKSIFDSVTSIYKDEYLSIIDKKENIEKVLNTCTSIFTAVMPNIEFMNTLSKYNTSDFNRAKNNIIIMTSTIFDAIGKTNKEIGASTTSIEELDNKVRSFSEIVRNLMEYGFSAGSVDISSIKEFTNSISELSGKSINIGEIKAEPLEKFVKASNSVNIQKVSKLTGLMEAMSKLADKIGGFDKLADALDEDFIDILNKLGDKVDSAKETITKAERIEKERQEKFNKNLEKISNIMKESISIKVGSLDEDGNLSAGYEKEK